MSSVEYLREFVNERLTAAAEEIFGAFKNIIVRYEEEIDRQCSLLEAIRKQEIKLHRIELPKQHACKREEILSDLQFCNQEENSSMAQEDQEYPNMKEEQKELFIIQEEEPLVVKQEADTFMLTNTHEEIDQREDQNLNMSPTEDLSAAQREYVIDMPVISSVFGAANSGQLLFSVNSHTEEIQDQKEVPFQKDLEFQPQVNLKANTGGKPYVCNVCGKDYSYISLLKVHMRMHTGEKPYVCKICGKDYKQPSHLTAHMRMHTGERPYVCEVCSKDFKTRRELTVHLRIHTGEKPYVCKTCGKHFRHSSHLTNHMKIHTAVKPCICKVCGNVFKTGPELAGHLRKHMSEQTHTVFVGDILKVTQN